MTKRTREQKIIADLRKQIALRDGVLKPVTAPKIELTTTPKFSLPIPTPVVIPQTEALSYNYLRRDLLRVGLVVAIAIGVEIIGAYLISSGSLKSWGIF